MAAAYRLCRSPARSATPRLMPPIRMSFSRSRVARVRGRADSAPRRGAAPRRSSPRRSAMPSDADHPDAAAEASVSTSPGRTSRLASRTLSRLIRTWPERARSLRRAAGAGEAGVPQPFVDALRFRLGHSRRLFSSSFFRAASAANGLSGSTGRSRGRSCARGARPRPGEWRVRRAPSRSRSRTSLPSRSRWPPPALRRGFAALGWRSRLAVGGRRSPARRRAASRGRRGSRLGRAGAETPDLDHLRLGRSSRGLRRRGRAWPSARLGGVSAATARRRRLLRPAAPRPEALRRAAPRPAASPPAAPRAAAPRRRLGGGSSAGGSIVGSSTGGSSDGGCSGAGSPGSDAAASRGAASTAARRAASARDRLGRLRPPLHAVAEALQDVGDVLAGGAEQRRHRRRHGEAAAVGEGAGGPLARAAGRPGERRADQVGEALQDVDAHGAAAVDAEAEAPIDVRVEGRIDRDRGAARSRRSPAARRGPARRGPCASAPRAARASVLGAGFSRAGT